VVARRELLAGLDQPKAGDAEAARGDQALDLPLGEEVVVPARLVASDDERPALPVLGEEFRFAERLDAAL
jgi:hypothetical protein